MKQDYDYILGIDPDTDKSGFALLDVNCKAFEFVGALTFVQGIKFLDTLAARGGRIQVVIEDSDTSTAYRTLYGKPKVVFAMGRSVGKCHATFEHLLQYAESVALKRTGNSRYRKYGAHIVTARFPMPNCDTKMCRASPAGRIPKCGMRVCWPCTARLSR